MRTSPRFIRRLVFQAIYSCFAIASTLWLAIFLQASHSGLYLFVFNDLLTEPQRLAFVLGFPITYLASLLALSFNLKIPRFDFFNRIVVINIIAFGFLGLALWSLRQPLISREVVITEILLCTTLLVLYYIISHRFYPKCFGVLPDVDITPFKAYPSLAVISVNSESVLDKKLDGVITNLRGKVDDETSQLLVKLAQKRMPIHDANSLIEMLWGRVPLADLTPVEIDSFTPPIIYGFIKRAAELSLIIVCTPLISVIWLMISISIKLDSKGPVLFTQTRSGLHGTTFTMLKFRSMYVTDKQENRFALKNDKRITRVGRLLRRVRLDELPQLWNVVCGDMSLIGPRPEQLEFTKRFDQLIPFYRFRYTVRPGITGWAQVMYGYADSDEQTRAKLEFDFFYIKHMSAWLDLVVLVKTIRTIVLGSGAR